MVNQIIDEIYRENIERKNESVDDEIITLKMIKGKKTKKILLTEFVENFNENIENEINKQKNKILLKGIFYNLNIINEDNILLKTDKIIYIRGIYAKNGLLNISSKLYKQHK